VKERQSDREREKERQRHRDRKIDRRHTEDTEDRDRGRWQTELGI